MTAPRVSPITIPDEYTVWAASDWHGQLAAVDRMLRASGLTDGGDLWTAPSGTALVITGDIVDRGPDSLGLVRRLVSLRAQAESRDGLVALLQGNHEIQVLGGLDGQPELFRALMTFGGGATLLATGMRPEEWLERPAHEIAARVDVLAPDLRPALWTFAPYARWRDVLLVHAGPVPFQDLETFEAGAERLWIRDAFFASAHPFPEAAAWTPYRSAGMDRVVFGHTPVAEPTFSHGGRAVNLDTWRGQHVTLARLAPGRELHESLVLAEPTAPRAIADAAISAAEVLAIDAALPPIVKAWWRSVQSPGDIAVEGAAGPGGRGV